MEKHISSLFTLILTLFPCSERPFSFLPHHRFLTNTLSAQTHVHVAMTIMALRPVNPLFILTILCDRFISKINQRQSYDF